MKICNLQTGSVFLLITQSYEEILNVLTIKIAKIHLVKLKADRILHIKINGKNTFKLKAIVYSKCIIFR